jgi:outer membrane protein TolC
LSQSEQLTQDNWPELALKGDYGRKEDTRFSDYDGEGSLSVVLSVPLFTGGTLYSNSQAKAHSEQIARVTQNTNLRKTVHLITNHRNLIHSLRKVYATQLTHLEQQQEIVQLSLKSYDIKQTSMQDLLTATNRLIDAKNALMETSGTLGTLYRQFAWELGKPFPSPITRQNR